MLTTLIINDNVESVDIFCKLLTIFNINYGKYKIINLQKINTIVFLFFINYKCNEDC